MTVFALDPRDRDDAAARARDAVARERRRIAVELHDGIAQDVLSAGYAVAACRADAARRDDPGAAAALERLTLAQQQLALAADRIRAAIYDLHRDDEDAAAGLVEQLLRLAERHDRDAGGQHAPDVRVEVTGRPVPLAAATVRGLVRIAGEAVANAVAHAKADEVRVRVRYRPASIGLSVTDDGVGDAAELQRLLGLERLGTVDGRHCGLAGMATRAEDLGARFALRPAPGGGVRVDVRLPMPAATVEGDA